VNAVVMSYDTRLQQWICNLLLSLWFKIAKVVTS